MVTISAAALCAPAVPVAATRPTSRRAWWPTIASRATSSCWRSGTSCSWAPRPSALPAFWLIAALTSADGRSCAGSRSSGLLCPRRSVGTGSQSARTWLVDETYVKMLGEWHYLFRGVDEDGQVLDCWL